MTLNEDSADDLRDALQRLSTHAANQSKLQHELLDQGRAAWQARVEATARIAAKVEIQLDGGLPDTCPCEP